MSVVNGSTSSANVGRARTFHFYAQVVAPRARAVGSNSTNRQKRNPTTGGGGDGHNMSPFPREGGGVSLKESLPGIYFNKPLLE